MNCKYCEIVLDIINPPGVCADCILFYMTNKKKLCKYCTRAKLCYKCTYACVNCNDTCEVFDNERVCLNCGTHNGYNLITGCAYSQKKTIYHRKYHLDKYLVEYDLSSANRQRFEDLFYKIIKVLDQIEGRKRSIKFEYIFQKIFKILKIEKETKLIKTKSTREKYNRIWKQVELRLNAMTV